MAVGGNGGRNIRPRSMRCVNDCATCERPRTVTLSDGRPACTYCHGWTIDCEARHLLSMAPEARQAAMEAREAKRGNVDALWAAMRRYERL